MSSLKTELDAIAAETAERAIRRLGHRSAILEPEFRSQALDLPPARSRQSSVLRAFELLHRLSRRRDRVQLSHDRTDHGLPLFLGSIAAGSMVSRTSSHRRAAASIRGSAAA